MKKEELAKLPKKDKLAFPCDGMYAGEARSKGDAGLTKREYFAAKAMLGIMGNLAIADERMAVRQREYWIETYGNITEGEAVAKESVKLADTLLRELEKPQSHE